ncbi:SDR family oxidoreductase [Planotetraspora kaengkrachanensis]|uniref:Short-chain dehydrogenase n=1 Tax=Planotetraspora kaengkrachanensis TaxID=575193 RepID=A0A8J3V7I5_9ACTN|nr:SDR family oxidoreductase [Planotetraspora kaengkrachanensis]GIG81014.1 short-chain dehydrogenase [Planotetraspora kaengkrachanensis]
MDLNLRGRRALITGSSKGIGAATAEALAEEGCDLHLAARNESALDDLSRRLRAAHSVDVSVHPVDLRRPEDLERLAGDVPDLDILVNNAGDIPGGSLDIIDGKAWRHGWDLKVFGYVDLTRLVYARMKARGRGVIINNIGNAGERVDSNYIAGSSGNAALMAFTRALGGRSLHDGIRVVGVNPGPVATERILTLLEKRSGEKNAYADLMAGYPLGRAADPREIADLIAFLASDRSAYTSGAVFTVDGGMSAAGA